MWQDLSIFLIGDGISYVSKLAIRTGDGGDIGIITVVGLLDPHTGYDRKQTSVLNLSHQIPGTYTLVQIQVISYRVPVIAYIVPEVIMPVICPLFTNGIIEHIFAS